jgi:trk system potassium uptake protein TrkH
MINGFGYALFHSISAFCNAGFDLEGQSGAFSSLCPYSVSIPVNLVIICLIISGGLGFRTWKDIYNNKWRIRAYSLQTKGILLMTFILISIPALVFFCSEYHDLPFKERVLASLFQSVTTRTAGFNTQDLTQLADDSKVIMIVLMLIGGAPGSTAGGMKVTTILVLLATSFSTFKNSDQTSLMKRTVSNDVVRKSAAIFMMYIFLFLISGMFISYVEGKPVLTCLFETASAIGTVGLTLGITPTLSLASKIVLMCLMYFGRVGGLTIIFAAVTYNPVYGKYPTEDVSVG